MFSTNPKTVPRKEDVASEFNEMFLRRRNEIEDKFGGERSVFDKPSCYKSGMDLIYVA